MCDLTIRALHVARLVAFTASWVSKASTFLWLFPIVLILHDSFGTILMPNVLPDTTFTFMLIGETTEGT